HRPRDGSAVGGYLISGLVRNITKRGLDVLLDTSVEEILMPCIIFDSSREALVAGLKAAPGLVKPNRRELEIWAGRKL
ncbi:hypothetical protein Q6286_26365, partial [Klebsiella pneumoniae]|nr:hypothetical protein [Klebsiella pneumoniae]